MRQVLARIAVVGWLTLLALAAMAQSPQQAPPPGKDFVSAMQAIRAGDVWLVAIEPNTVAKGGDLNLRINLDVELADSVPVPKDEDVATQFVGQFSVQGEYFSGNWRGAKVYRVTRVSDTTVRVQLDAVFGVIGVRQGGASRFNIRLPGGGVSDKEWTINIAEESFFASTVFQNSLLTALGIVMATLLAWRVLRQRRRDPDDVALESAIQSAGAKMKIDVEALERAVPLPLPPEELSDQPSPPPRAEPPRVPDSLVQSLQKRDAVLVVGAGVSAQAGLTTRNQFWLDMIGDLRGLLGEELVRSLTQVIEQRGADQVVETVLARAGREAVVDAIGSRVGHADVIPSMLHRDLAELPWHVVVDFTWDTLALEAFSGKNPRLFASPLDSTELPAALREAEKSLPILKAYGTIKDRASLILTPQQYRSALQRSPEFVRAIGSLFTTKDFLFVGVALDTIDRFLEALPPDFEARHRNHLALLPATAEAEVWRQGVGARFGIELLTYDPHDQHIEVPEFFTRLSLRYDARQDQALTTTIGRLSRIRISNIGHFAGDSLASDAATAATTDKPAATPTAGLDLTVSEENWTLILGNNGSGKSTLLRAMALALCAEDERARGAAQRLLRFGQRQGDIEITMGGNIYRTSLLRESDRVNVRAPADTPLTSKVAVVLGFPAIRGVMTRAPSGPREMKPQDPTVEDVMPLINNVADNRLDDLRQWILNKMVAAERGDTTAATTLEMIRHIISDLVPGEQVKLSRFDDKSFGIFLIVGGQEVPFELISQGMASVFNWVGWLMQRLDDVYQHNPRSHGDQANGVDPRQALVLVDEVDAHLHPNWQRAAVGIVRKRFPNVQVIATSHSALLAGALPSRTIRVVERDGETGLGQVSEPDREVKGRTADDVYSSLFGLNITRDPETEKRILEYFDLYENTKRGPEGDKELAKLEKWFERLDYGGDVIVTTVRRLVQERRPSPAAGRDLEQVEAGLTRLRE